MTPFEKPTNEQSAKLLATAIRTLGDSEQTRRVVHTVYAAGRIDGQIEKSDEADAAFRRILAGVTG